MLGGVIESLPRHGFPAAVCLALFGLVPAAAMWTLAPPREIVANPDTIFSETLWALAMIAAHAALTAVLLARLLAASPAGLEGWMQPLVRGLRAWPAVFVLQLVETAPGLVVRGLDVLN